MGKDEPACRAVSARGGNPVGTLGIGWVGKLRASTSDAQPT